MTPEPDAEVRYTNERSAGVPAAAEERPGDAVCWLRRVCPSCGTLADVDPPTTCAHCHTAIPAE